MVKIRIIAIGKSVPGKPMDNTQLLRLTNIGLDSSWIEKKLSIKTRYVSRAHPTTLEEEKSTPISVWKHWGVSKGNKNSELSARACFNALSKAQIEPNDLELLIHTSCTPDYPLPPTSTLVQDLLGIKKTLTIDIRSACCGSSQGLCTAIQYLKAGTVRNACVVGAEVGSLFGSLDSDEPGFTRGDAINACMIGDGAAAVVLAAFPDDSSPRGLKVLDIQLGSIGLGQKSGMWLPGGGSVHPCNQNTIDRGLHKFHHEYRKVLESGPKLFFAGINEIFTRNNLTFDDIDLIIPHQANGKIREMATKFHVPVDKIFMNFEKYGNTANASLFLCLSDLVEEANLEPGAKILLLAAESTKWMYGATLIQWDPIVSEPKFDSSVPLVARKKSVTNGSSFMSRLWFCILFLLAPIALSLFTYFSSKKSAKLDSFLSQPLKSNDSKDVSSFSSPVAAPVASPSSTESQKKVV